MLAEKSMRLRVAVPKEGLNCLQAPVVSQNRLSVLHPRVHFPRECGLCGGDTDVVHADALPLEVQPLLPAALWQGRAAHAPGDRGRCPRRRRGPRCLHAPCPQVPYLR